MLFVIPVLGRKHH